MARKQSSLTITLHYALLRLVVGIITFLPLGVAVAIGRGLGGLLFALDKRHRKRCSDAIRASLGVDETKATAITLEMYRHIGTMLAEFPRQPQITLDTLDSIMDWGEGGKESLTDLLAEGKGIVLFTGHIGNWEVTGHCVSYLGVSEGSIARPLDNPLINDWITRIRTSGKQTIWQKQGAMLNALRALRKGLGFGILNDQNGGEDGEFVPFFGQEASTVYAAIDLAIRTGAPIQVVASQRIGPMRHRFCSIGPIRPNPEAEDKVAERRRLLILCNEALESIIRQAPEQWLWLHARWKTKRKIPAK